VRAALAGGLLVVVATSTGCLVRRRKIERPARAHAGLLTAGLDELAARLQQRYESIETLNATVDLEPSLISASRGEIADYKDVRGFILVRKPSWIRVIAQYPIVRGTAFDMVSDGSTFRLHLPSRNLFLTGPNRLDKPSPKKLENLRPQHLLEALLIQPPDGANEQVMLESFSDEGGASYLVHVVRHDAAGRLQLARKVWFDRLTLEIVRQQVFDAAGDPVTDARYAGWERRDGVLFPGHIVITRPKDGYELSIRFRKTMVNQPLPEDRFQLPEPPGVQVRRLGGGADD
jgi:outer membrane lipoprotein-sorting protein